MCILGWMYYYVPPSMMAVVNRQDHLQKAHCFDSHGARFWLASPEQTAATVLGLAGVHLF